MPPAAATIRSSPPAAPARFAISDRLAAGESAVSTSSVAPAGRAAGSSARATQTSSTGTAPSAASTAVRRSSSAGSARCASSTTSTSGRSRASAPSRWPNAQTRLPPASSSARPTAAATRRAAAGGIARSAASSSHVRSPRACTTASRSGHSDTPWPRAGQWPVSTVPVTPASSATSRDLPIPGSPSTVRISGAPRLATRANVARSSASSRSRPTSGRSCRRRIAGASASIPRSRQLPSGRPDARTPCPTTRQVASASRTSPRPASRPSRSATAIASPTTWSSPAVRTSPVQAPQRTPSPNGRRAEATSSAAAAIARCASSSCAAGMPNTATTASPRSSTTRPRWRPHVRSATAWKRSSAACSVSGSSAGPAVWANTQVTQRRAAARAAAGGRAGAGRSWRRIAASSSRSRGDGSTPSPSTSARRASR